MDASIDAYNATLLRALREVADEISTLQSLERQQGAQQLVLHDGVRLGRQQGPALDAVIARRAKGITLEQDQGLRAALNAKKSASR